MGAETSPSKICNYIKIGLCCVNRCLNTRVLLVVQCDFMTLWDSNVLLICEVFMFENLERTRNGYKFCFKVFSIENIFILVATIMILNLFEWGINNKQN
jgi:hypothetical protein